MTKIIVTIKKKKNEKTPIQLIHENRCWDCALKLKPYKGISVVQNTFECPKCHELYFSCFRCSKENNNKPVNGIDRFFTHVG